jgi:hypothetical protein
MPFLKSKKKEGEERKKMGGNEMNSVICSIYIFKDAYPKKLEIPLVASQGGRNARWLVSFGWQVARGGEG